MKFEKIPLSINESSLNQDRTQNVVSMAAFNCCPPPRFKKMDQFPPFVCVFALPKMSGTNLQYAKAYSWSNN